MKKTKLKLNASTRQAVADFKQQKCPSCGVAYEEHVGLAGTCAALKYQVKETVKLRMALRKIARPKNHPSLLNNNEVTAMILIAREALKP